MVLSSRRSPRAAGFPSDNRESSAGREPGLGDSHRSGAWAALVWLLCLPIAFWLPGAVDHSPFTLQGSATPLVVGAALMASGLLVARRRQSWPVAGLVAGAFAGWVALTMHTGLHGTPYGFFDSDDTLRLSAMAERYTTTIHSADGIVGSVPSEYPPLFPWLIGRVAVIADVPAWRLLGIAETILTSAVIVVGFALWRRMLSDWVALVVALVTFTVFLNPAKPYEVMALDVTIPWVLATFAQHSGRRLGWMPAGIVGGLLITLYQGYLTFTALGIVILIAITWRATPHRGQYARHVAGVVIVALAVSSWYLAPYVSWALSHGLQETDRFQDPLIAMNPFPFLSVTPVGALTAVGLVGVVWYRHLMWWARPLLLLTLSAYVYRFAAEALFIGNGHTLVLQYTVYVIIASLSVAGVLTAARGLPALLRRLAISPPTGLGALAVGLVVMWAATNGWYDWLPGLPPPTDQFLASTRTSGSQSTVAFLMALPDGSYPRFAPTTGRLAWFPTSPIVHDVQSVLGRHSAPVTLSWSETLFATQPWPGFIAVGANAAPGTEHWFSRVAALKTLSRTTNPTAFAHASAHTPYGAIDAFVLHQHGGLWYWAAYNNPTTITFSPTQFARSTFVTFRGLPNDTVVAVRRPGR